MKGSTNLVKPPSGFSLMLDDHAPCKHVTKTEKMRDVLRVADDYIVLAIVENKIFFRSAPMIKRVHVIQACACESRRWVFLGSHLREAIADVLLLIYRKRFAFASWHGTATLQFFYLGRGRSTEARLGHICCLSSKGRG